MKTQQDDVTAVTSLLKFTACQHICQCHSNKTPSYWNQSSVNSLTPNRTLQSITQIHYCLTRKTYAYILKRQTRNSAIKISVKYGS